MSRALRARRCAALLLFALACDQRAGGPTGASPVAIVYPPAPTAGAPASPPVAAVGQAPDARAANVAPAARRARVSLIDHARWTRLEGARDPFPDRPAQVDCAADAVGPEDLGGERAYGVDTGGCAYLTVEQAARTSVASGETIVVRLWHFALDAPEPAEAHAVVEIDGLRALDTRVPIPAAGGLIKVERPIERAVAADRPVRFHLHNHGANSWALVEVSAGPPGGP